MKNECYANQYTNRCKNDFHKAVEALDVFTKALCMDVDRMNAEEDLFFMCKQCPFAENKDCLVKKFKGQFCPDYKNFGSMGDLWRIYENR